MGMNDRPEITFETRRNSQKKAMHTKFRFACVKGLAA